MLILSTQISIFEGIEENVKTQLYIKEYCKAKQNELLDETELRLCTGLMFNWLQGAILSEGIITKYIGLYRLSEIEQSLATSKISVLNSRRAKRKEFLQTIFTDTTDYCHSGGFGIFGCLVKGGSVNVGQSNFEMPQKEKDSFTSIIQELQIQSPHCNDDWRTNCGKRNDNVVDYEKLQTFQQF